MPAAKKFKKQQDNDYVPPQEPPLDYTESEAEEESYDEEEEEDEDDEGDYGEEEGEEEEVEVIPPPQKVKLIANRSPRKKSLEEAAALAANNPKTLEMGERNKLLAAAAVKKASGVRKRKSASSKDKEQKVEKLKIRRKTPGSSDFEIQLDPKAHVSDFSTVQAKYPKTKLLLDDRHWARVATVSMKSRAISYDQLLIGRDPTKTTEAGQPSNSRTFQMGLPLRCIEPLLRALKFLTGQEQEEKTVL